MKKRDYKPEVCLSCGQTMTYVLGIDCGTVDILKAMSTAIRRKGKNEIHPRKEMEIGRHQIDYMTMVREGQLTSTQVNNLSRLRFHGLIASIEKMSGFYCLTRKGAAFLRGEPVERFAVVSKAKSKLIGYLPDEFCTIKDFKPDQEYWEGMHYVTDEFNRALRVDVPNGGQATLFPRQNLFLKASTV